MNNAFYAQSIYATILEKIEADDSFEISSVHIKDTCQQIFVQKEWCLPKSQKNEIMTEVIQAICAFGPIQSLLEDPQISEIMVNGPDNIFIETRGKLIKSTQKFWSESQLLQVIDQIVSQIGRRIDESSPLVDARLPDGSRVNVIIPPLSLCGPVLTIRKFPQKSFTVQDMLQNNSLDPAMISFLTQAIADKKNILISGGTGSGKTSTLNACAQLIPHDQRLITIEDAAEIKIDHPHLISLESRNANLEGQGHISIRDLVKNALRMRPDRIVVGEIRSEEAIDMLQAMNTGHKGSLTTVHANTPLESLFRIETMVLMGGVKIPLPAITSQITQGIDFILQQERLPSGERKIVEIAELQKTNTDSGYQLKTCFKYDRASAQFKSFC